MNYIRLDYWDLGLAALLLVGVAALSLLLQPTHQHRLRSHISPAYSFISHFAPLPTYPNVPMGRVCIALKQEMSVSRATRPNSVHTPLML